MIVVPAISASYLLDSLLELLGDEVYHLYTNPLVLGPGVTLGSFVEATFPGYAPQSARWFSSIWNGNRAVAEGSALVWNRITAGPVEQVFGYFVTQKLGGKLLWCEQRDAGPVPLSKVGDQVEVMPRITLRQQQGP